MVSLTLTRCRCARLLRERRGEHIPWPLGRRASPAGVGSHRRGIWDEACSQALQRQQATLVIDRFAALVVAVVPFGPDSRRIFRLGHRRDPGVHGGTASGYRSGTMAETGKRAWLVSFLEELRPWKSSSPSFIGVDGTNTTLNSGRIYTTRSQSGRSIWPVPAIIIRRSWRLRVVDADGITLRTCRPRRPHGRRSGEPVSRFQHTPEDAGSSGRNSNRWALKTLGKFAAACAELRDVGSDPRIRDWRRSGDSTAMRCGRTGITPQASPIPIRCTTRVRPAAGSPPCLHAVNSVSRHSGGHAGEFHRGPEALQALPEGAPGTGGLRAAKRLLPDVTDTTVLCVISRQGPVLRR